MFFLKKSLFVLPIILGLISFYNLSSGNNFNAFLWISIAIISLFFVIPASYESDDKSVPILQIFIGLIVFILIFAVFAFYDFVQLNYPLEEALIYSFFVGIGFVIAMMIIKGK